MSFYLGVSLGKKLTLHCGSDCMVYQAFKHSTCGFLNTICSTANFTSMASSHETKNHTEIQFKLSYHEGSELLLCVALTLDKGVTSK
jgi:hypothetical protein